MTQLQSTALLCSNLSRRCPSFSPQHYSVQTSPEDAPASVHSVTLFKPPQQPTQKKKEKKKRGPLPPQALPRELGEVSWGGCCSRTWCACQGKSTQWVFATSFSKLRPPLSPALWRRQARRCWSDGTPDSEWSGCPDAEQIKQCALTSLVKVQLIKVCWSEDYSWFVCWHKMWLTKVCWLED